jgi:hypothetical protein
MVVKTAAVVVPQGVAVVAAKERPLFTISVSREDLLVRIFYDHILTIFHTK